MESINPQRIKQKNCEFIDKLVDMMDKYPQFIHWTDDGAELIIQQLKEVQTKILPDYFRHQNFASFVRQLNMYGFCKKEKSSEFLRFYHATFRKDNENCFHIIQRKTKMRTTKNSESKFYQSNNKLIEKLKTKSGLSDEAQELTVTLLQHKDNIQDVLRRIKSQLDKLFVEMKDTRSKSVLQTLDFIQNESYTSVVRSISKGKQIDECVNVNFKNEKEQVYDNFDDECSLQDQLESEKVKNEDSGEQIDNLFQVGQDQLSDFNAFHND